jgi:hypothetical protein
MSANRILAATIAISISAIAATPAFAINGRQAVGMCIDQTGCTFGVGKDGKNIDILTADGTYIHCPDAKSECTIPRKGKKGRAVSGAASTSGIVQP